MIYSAKALQKRIKEEKEKEDTVKRRLLKESSKKIADERKYRNGLYKKIFQPCIEAALNGEKEILFFDSISEYEKELINLGFRIEKNSLTFLEIKDEFSYDSETYELICKSLKIPDFLESSSEIEEDIRLSRVEKDLHLLIEEFNSKIYEFDWDDWTITTLEQTILDELDELLEFEINIVDDSAFFLLVKQFEKIIQLLKNHSKEKFITSGGKSNSPARYALISLIANATKYECKLQEIVDSFNEYLIEINNPKTQKKYVYSILDWYDSVDSNKSSKYSFFSPNNLNELFDNDFFKTLFKKIEMAIKKGEFQLNMVLKAESNEKLNFDNHELGMSIEDLAQILKCLQYKITNKRSRQDGNSPLAVNLKVSW